MPKRAVALSPFDQLYRKVKAQLEAGAEELVRRRWYVGRDLKVHILKYGQRAKYGKEVFKKLAGRLGINDDILYECVHLFEAHPRISLAPRKLSWTHNLILLRVSDPTERQKLAKFTVDKSLNSDQLKAEVRKSNAKPVRTPSEKSGAKRLVLPYVPGILYHYQIIKPRVPRSEPPDLVVDLGFKNHYPADSLKRAGWQAGQVICSVKRGTGYGIKRTDVSPKKVFTCVAYVVIINDADTYHFEIDQGFKMWRSEKIRLRGIDCPELSTGAGQLAKQFVEAELKPCPFVVIKTYKQEKYGRYLVDIFYRSGESDPQKVASEGIFLNQRLLDEGHAKPWKD